MDLSPSAGQFDVVHNPFSFAQDGKPLTSRVH